MTPGGRRRRPEEVLDDTAGGASWTREEVAEMLGVALLMEGGPASVYGSRVWDAFDELATPHGTTA